MFSYVCDSIKHTKRLNVEEVMVIFIKIFIHDNTKTMKTVFNTLFLLIVLVSTSVAQQTEVKTDSTITSIEDNDFSKQISVFPNPASQHIFLSNVSDLSSQNMKIEIVDVSGKIVLSQDNIFNQRIDISSLRPNFYLLRIINEDKIGLKRILVK